MFNTERNPDRPVSWAFSDDILDRNIDQLDRETPRCNLSEEEEDQLEKSKLAIESQNKNQTHKISSSVIPNSWIVSNDLQNGSINNLSTNSQTPVSTHHEQSDGKPPYMERMTREQIKNRDEGEKHYAHGTVATSGKHVPSMPHSTSFSGISEAGSRIGYASPTFIHSASQPSNLQHMKSPRLGQFSSKGSIPTSSQQSTNIQAHHMMHTVPLANSRSFSVTSSIGSKPLGMVTPQMPSNTGHSQVPKSSASSQLISHPSFNQSKTPSSSQSSKTNSAQLSPQGVKKLPTQMSKNITSQTAMIIPQMVSKNGPQQNPYRPLANYTNDQLKFMHKHCEGFCHIPNCQSCLEVRKLKDDPTKKAQLIRQVEDEILLRSRELDSCWQEDELDYVRDFTDMDRRKEMTYAETSEEGIYKRVSDEIIKRPPIWHDDEVDSVKDFSGRKGQDGNTSKVNSEEKVCLSPPWNEEDEELLARQHGVVMVHDIKPITSSSQRSDPAISVPASSESNQTSSAQASFSSYNCYDGICTVKEYTSTYNNGQEIGSRIPSSERISLTPPWTPSGCQTPAEGVPLLSNNRGTFSTTAVSNTSTNSTNALSPKESVVSSPEPSGGKIDTSGVKLRKKTKNQASHCAPYVVPRFDDLEEDSVKDYSAESRQLQELSSKMPSYEYIPFTPPWISNNNSGIQTPRNYSMEVNNPVSPDINNSSLAMTTSLSAPTMSTKSSVANEAQTAQPVLENFRNCNHYGDVYGDSNTGADSVKNYSKGLIEETSRIPSCEQLCFTPPWLETEGEHVTEENFIGDSDGGQLRQEITLEEQRAIEEEVRKTGADEPGVKDHEPGKAQTEVVVDSAAQPAVSVGPPGRDSGFCSEQDQKQKQQEQQNEENGVVSEEPGKQESMQNQVQYQQDLQQCQINAANENAENVTASQERCWSSKESTGSNQTDISTVVNPATSVPITAPGSPDPDGSEASNTDASDNEPSRTCERDEEQEITPPERSTASNPIDHKYMMDGNTQHPYLHRKQHYNIQHSVQQTGGNDLPMHHTFPRASVSGQHFYPVSYDTAPQSYGEAMSRSNGTYPMKPQGYSKEAARPRLHVSPYPGQFQPRSQMNFPRGQMPSNRGMHYQNDHQPSLHQQQQVLRHQQLPNPLPRQIIPKQQQMNFHPIGQGHIGQGHQMPQGQRSQDFIMQNQPSYFLSQMHQNEQQVQGVSKPGYVSRHVQMDANHPGDYTMTEEHSKNFHQGLLNIARQEENQWEEKAVTKSEGPPRSVSQLNLPQSQDAQKNADSASVVSFSSMAASHQNLDTKVDMVSSLLSMLGTHDKDDVARTLLAMSSSTDSCSAMRQSGCLPLLIKLLHDPAYETEGINWEARDRAGRALHNIINSGTGDRRGRREVRVLRLIEIVRTHSEAVLSGNMEKHQSHRNAPALREHGPGPAVAALMKLSFEEEHKNTITELGGLQVIAELLQVDYKLNGQCKDPYSITLRKYAGMALINLTYSDSKNKRTLLEMTGAVRAIIAGLSSVDEEDLVQVSAGIIRNLSWRSDETGKRALAENGAARCLMHSGQHMRSEASIRSVLSAVWNLSAHSPDNKEEICSTPGSLKFLCYALNYRSPTRSLAIPENAGGILRNISSHIAVKMEYRQILREHGCLKVLISHLRSPSTRIISNACGILWNLSARCIEDQELLWELGAVSILKTLVTSKHKSISTSSASALRNLMAVKPGSSSTDTESHASFKFKRSNTLPGKGQAQTSHSNLRSDRKYKSLFGKKHAGSKENNQNAPGIPANKKQGNRPAQEDSRKVHRKVNHGEPHFYADLYQDPPRRGITMPKTKDPTTVLYASEAGQNNNEMTEGIPMQYNANHGDRWNNAHSACNCKYGRVYKEDAPMEMLHHGLRDMRIEEESPLISRQRKDSSTSSSSCSPPVQPPMSNYNSTRINTENSPLAIFREKKGNIGLNGHRRSMSDTISECGHPVAVPQPLHAVTDSELAKRDVSEFNSATFRKDEHSSWHDLLEAQPHRASQNRRNKPTDNSYEMQELSYRASQHGKMYRKRYDDVMFYETHFLSPYDDCPLSKVTDALRYPSFSHCFRATQDYSHQDPATPKVFVHETRYDVRQAHHRRSNETIASSLYSSREELVSRCKHNHSGTSVWQCDCYETGNVWVLQRGEKRSSKKTRKQKKEQSAAQQCNPVAVQRGMSNQSLQCIQMETISRSNTGIIDSGHGWPQQLVMSQEGGSRSNVFPGKEPKMRFQEKMISSPQGQFGLATPIKDPNSGSELAIATMISSDACPQVSHNHSSSKDKLAMEKASEQTTAKKPLRSSLKTPSDSLRKFRKKHVTQKIVTSVDKKKEKSKDNLMVTSL